nr:MAG TPA: hypothetical protein [Caudoviricetes sp.]
MCPEFWVHIILQHGRFFIFLLKQKTLCIAKRL